MKKNQVIINTCLFILALSLGSCGKQAINIYISTTGNNSGSGTKTSPFNSFETARNAVRLIRKKTPHKPVLIHVKGGRYILEKTMVFTNDDSGSETAPITYLAAKGEEPIISGSRELTDWQLAGNSYKLELLRPEIKEKIYVLDLKSAGITDFGDPIKTGSRPELFCNGQIQTLARWPNKGFVKAGLVQGKTKKTSLDTTKVITVEGVFEYTEKEQNRWMKEHDACLEGYWYKDWCDESQRVNKVDTISRTLFLREPYHQYGYRDSLRYFGFNMFCEIDQPGEWYLDRNEGLLYWYPPEGINPANAAVTLSVFDSPFMLEMKNCSYTSFKGITFREGRGSAISIQDGKNCHIVDCKIEGFGRDGIHIEEGQGHGISGCLIRTLGCSGIKIKGGDRKNLIAANHFVENTIIEHFSLFKHTYEPAVYVEGCGIRINNNRFSYSASSAMRLEGNDIMVEYNQISHVASESDDQGGLDMYYNPSYCGIVIRFNHWSDISGGTHYGAAGVRLDDMISYVKIYGNVFERCGSRHFGAVQINGGKDNVIENNLFYDCLAAASFTTHDGDKYWLEQLDSPVIQKKIFDEVDIHSNLYQNRYPELKSIRQNAEINIIKNNLLVDCNEPFLRDFMKQVFENNIPVLANGKSLEEFCDDELLQSYGLKSIPFKEMGPKKNQWLRED